MPPHDNPAPDATLAAHDHLACAATHDRRLTELELGYMTLEHLVHELSSVVAQQQRALDTVRAELLALQQRAHGEPEAPRARLEDERPPHY